MSESLKPLVYPMHVRVRMGGHLPGRSSFVSTSTITVDEELFARGSSRVVWVDPELGESVAMPESVRQLSTPDGEPAEGTSS